jgi:hypothetical protein
LSSVRAQDTTNASFALTPTMAARVQRERKGSKTRTKIPAPQLVSQSHRCECRRRHVTIFLGLCRSCDSSTFTGADREERVAFFIV